MDDKYETLEFKSDWYPKFYNQVLYTPMTKRLWVLCLQFNKAVTKLFDNYLNILKEISCLLIAYKNHRIIIKCDIL